MEAYVSVETQKTQCMKNRRVHEENGPTHGSQYTKIEIHSSIAYMTSYSKRICGRRVLLPTKNTMLLTGRGIMSVTGKSFARSFTLVSPVSFKPELLCL